MKMFTRAGKLRIATALLATPALALGLAACDGRTDSSVESGEPDSIADAAADEGIVMWYTGSLPDQNQAVADAFTAKYGIRVEVLRADASDLLPRVESEISSGNVQADVFSISNRSFMVDGASQDWWAPLVEAEIPSLTAWPDDALLGDGTVAITATAPMGICYNTDRIGSAEAPKVWEDLLDPALTGVIGLTKPGATATGNNFLYFLDTEISSTFITELGAQQLVITDFVPGIQALAAGEIGVFIPCFRAASQGLIASGAPIEFVDVQHTSGTEQNAAVLADSPHPNAARLFMDFLLSEEGQSVYLMGTDVSRMPDVPGTASMPERYIPPGDDKATAVAEDLAALLG